MLGRACRLGGQTGNQIGHLLRTLLVAAAVLLTTLLFAGEALIFTAAVLGNPLFLAARGFVIAAPLIGLQFVHLAAAVRLSQLGFERVDFGRAA